VRFARAHEALGPPLGLPLRPGPSPGPSPGSWWDCAGALGSQRALRGSGSCGGPGPSGALPGTLPWALGLPWAPSWALWGPFRYQALAGPLQIRQQNIFNVGKHKISQPESSLIEKPDFQTLETSRTQKLLQMKPSWVLTFDYVSKMCAEIKVRPLVDEAPRRLYEAPGSMLGVM